MMVYCITSDAYRHLVCGFAERFNAYWPNQDVTVLCYSRPDDEDKLPPNFWVHSLGNQADYGKAWTTGLIPFFAHQRDPYFVLMLEDYWLNKPVNIDAINVMASILNRDAMVVKCELTAHGKGYRCDGEYQPGIIIRHQGARYRTSLQAAIWRRWYFQNLLQPDRTAWEFELKGEKSVVQDGWVILCPDKAAVSYRNVAQGGKP